LLNSTFELTKTAEHDEQAKHEIEGYGIMKHSVDKLKQIYDLANILNENDLHTENKIL
jgi:hypothetical protein